MNLFKIFLNWTPSSGSLNKLSLLTLQRKLHFPIINAVETDDPPEKHILQMMMPSSLTISKSLHKKKFNKMRNVLLSTTFLIQMSRAADTRGENSRAWDLLI